jgi:hypothetical protein
MTQSDERQQCVLSFQVNRVDSSVLLLDNASYHVDYRK